jgi:hypothetical protein
MDTKAREQELEQLAFAVLEFGKMRCQFYQVERKTVDVKELALRLRETTRAITRTLKLLEKGGLAERTDVSQFWRLYVRDLDRRIDLADRTRQRSYRIGTAMQGRTRGAWWPLSVLGFSDNRCDSARIKTHDSRLKGMLWRGWILSHGYVSKMLGRVT